MKQVTVFRTAAIAAGVAISLAGCSNGSQAVGPLPGAATASASQSSAHPGYARAGIRPASVNGYLYVADDADNVIKVVSNRGYRDAGIISAGIANPLGVTLDKSGNLYVANMQGGNVTEYSPGSTTPTFTYSEAMIQPNSVTTDSHGNLFEGDFRSGINGVVNEYYQGLNSAVASCEPGIGLGGNNGVTGVAVDKNGDVFVAYLTSGTTGGVIEYVNGLSNCYAEPLPISFNYPGGMAFDASGDLVVCETLSNVVDVIAPPYTSVTRTIATGFSQPLSISLSPNNKHAFIAYNHDVVIVDYQTGSTIKVLDNGFDDNGGAVDGPNAVY